MKPFSLTTQSLPLRDWTQSLTSNMTAREKSLLTILGAALIVSATFSIIGFIQRNSYLIPQTGGTYTEAAVGQPRHINPILAGANDLDLDISSLVYSSLFKVNNDLELENDLATGYEISEDNLTYVITLRDDVQWHDGEPFSADDVVFTIRSIQAPDYGSPLESSFQGVEVEKVDDYTVQFKLSQPYAPFMYNLTVGIAPRHVWEDIPPKHASLAEQMLKPVGTGPFRFSEIVTRRRTGEITNFKLVRNKDYYGQRPYLEEVVMTFYPTNEDAISALLSGNVSGVGFVPVSKANSLRSRSAINVRHLLLPQYFSFFFNEIKNEALGDGEVRAALRLATDRQKIVEEALKGEADPLHIPIPPGKFNFNEDFEEVKFDRELARQTLEEAGWKDENNDGIRQKDGEALRLTITTTDWPEYVKTAEIIQEEWQAIGVDVTVQSIGAGAIQQSVVSPRDYEVLLYGQILPANPDPYPFWHSTQTRNPGLNLSLLKDEEIDKQLEEARKIGDNEDRQEKYLEFQKRFLELNPAIVLYQPYYLFAQHQDVRGQALEQAPLPHDRFNDIENWHVRVKRVWNRN